jgi:TonB-dependent SusC/RagA subfamily outer membrane receptor
MRTLRQQMGPTWIVASVVTLAAGCARPPMASPLGPGAALLSNPQVAVGYATQPARDLAVAVGSVDARSSGNEQFSSVEDMLAGRVAGLDVRRGQDGRFSLRIRGTTSIVGNNEPLLVIDGMTVNSNAADALSMLLPRDVQRVDVLKDAGATAIYGSRGANGVIVITTRRAR